MGRIRARITLAGAMALTLGAAAVDAIAGAACPTSRFGGEVSRGQPFEHPLGGDLVFHLAPSPAGNPPGWTIEVRSPALPGPENEFSWVVTPPYRAWNPRYLDTSYGWSAREAITFGPRDFHFVTSGADYRSAAEAVRKLLWPAGLPERELEEARRDLDGVRRATGRLVILDSRLGGMAQGDPGRIEWIRFEVEVCLPTDP